MAIVTFDIPNTIVQELNGIAVEAGFPNAKVMVIAYLTAEIKDHRDNLAKATIPETSTSDVVIT